MRSLYWRLSLLVFLQYFIWGSWLVTLGTYLLETLHFSGREVGIVYGATAIAATVSPFWVGLLADRKFAVQRIMGALQLLAALFLALASTMTNFGWFYLLLLANTLCYLPTFSLVNAFCFHHLPDGQRQFPRVRVWGTIAWVLAGLLLSYFHWEASVMPLRMAAAVGALLGIYCFTLPDTPPQPGGARNLRQLFGGDMRDLIRDPALSVLFIALALCSFPVAYYYSFVNPFLKEIGLPSPAGAMTLGQVSEAAVMLLMPWALRTLSFRYLIFTGLLVWGVRYAFFILGDAQGGAGWLYLGIFMHGIAFGCTALAAQIYIDGRAPRHLRSTAQGFISFLTLGVGVFVGSGIAGETVNWFTQPDGSHHWDAIWWFPTLSGMLVAGWFLWRFPAKT